MLDYEKVSAALNQKLGGPEVDWSRSESVIKFVESPECKKRFVFISVAHEDGGWVARVTDRGTVTMHKSHPVCNIVKAFTVAFLNAANLNVSDFLFDHAGLVLPPEMYVPVMC